MEHRVLVTGATSKVGKELVQRLPASGALVRAASRCLLHSVPRGVSTVAFDYRRPSTWDAALDGVRQVFLVVPFGEPDAHAVCVPFVERALRARVQRLVLLGVMDADFDADSVLARVERHVVGSEVTYTVLRANWLMQNFSEGPTRDSIVANRAIFAPAGDGQVSYVDARDVAEVAARVLTTPGHDGQVYTLTGPQGIGHERVALLIAQACGRPITYTPTNDSVTREAYTQAAMPVPQVELMLDLFSRLRRDEFATVSDDLMRVLGRPATSFEMFARDHAHCW